MHIYPHWLHIDNSVACIPKVKYLYRIPWQHSWLVARSCICNGRSGYSQKFACKFVFKWYAIARFVDLSLNDTQSRVKPFLWLNSYFKYTQSRVLLANPQTLLPCFQVFYTRLRVVWSQIKKRSIVHIFYTQIFVNGGTALLRVGVTASQLDLPSLTPLFVADCGRHNWELPIRLLQ